MKVKIAKSVLFVFFLMVFLMPRVISAEDNFDIDGETANYKEEILEGKIIEVSDIKQISFDGGETKQIYQKLKVFITKGSFANKEIEVESGNFPSSNIPEYKKGDKVIVSYTTDIDGNEIFYVTDYIRRLPMLYLFVIFVVLAITVGGLRGALSLVGMAISFIVIFTLVLPGILSGKDPVETAILGSFIIIPVTFILSHGFNKKTGVAIAGTIISLIIVGILSLFFVDLTKLTGFASEEAGFLQTMLGGGINTKGMLLAGIIIGVLGVLDDITISQSAIVFQLKDTDKNMKPAELFKRAMDVGKDHISSMVNTLILVYTGAAMPLLIIFISSSHPFTEIINYEIVADEIVRMLVGSIGLITAVPITTFIAVIATSSRR